MERICPHCENPFPPSRRSDAKYCSSDCLKKHHYQINKERIKAAKRAQYVPKVPQQRSCLHCGLGFVASRSDVIYCSDVCNKSAWQLRHSDEVAARSARLKRERTSARVERLAADEDRKQTNICKTNGCQVTNAEDPHFRAGMCSLHYQRHRRVGQRIEDLGIRICPQCGGGYVHGTP